VALDAKVQVSFDPDVVAEYRLLGYENRAIDDEAFRDPGLQAGAIGAGHEVTALYVIRLQDDAADGDALGTIRLRWTEPGDRGESRLSRVIDADRLARSFRATDATFKLDAIVAAAAEVLRGSPYAEHIDVRDVVEVALASSGELPQTDQVHEFLDFIERVASLED